MGTTAEFKDFNNLFIWRSDSNSLYIFRLLETFVHTHLAVLSVDEDSDDDLFDDTDSECREKGLGSDDGKNE